MKKWILPGVCLLLNAVLLVGNYKLHQSNVEMHASNVALYEQTMATQEAFEHRYDGYHVEIKDIVDFTDYPDKAAQAEKNKYYAKRELMYMNMPAGPTDVVFVGDSQTDRCSWEEFYPDLNVKRRAIVADTIYGVHSRMDTILATKPSKIFILIGSNDLYALSMEKHEEATSTDDLIAVYQDIIETFQANAPEATIYVESVLPMREEEDEREDYNALIQEFNPKLANLCREKQVEYMDLWSLLADADGTLKEEYSLDGLHISSKAYAVIKKQVDRVIYQ
ncbi:MAG: hypothetical protein K6G04_00375 [Lachnospiraceae bacterium]|nr:hypothetical protein [Lachnospiraceae bacterium]